MKFDIRSFAEEKDQREALLKATADALGGIELMRNRVLVATYVEPAKTAGGIILPDRALDESRFQGKVGLVLRMGPMAFKFPDEIASTPPVVGDWVFYRPSDAMEMGIRIVGTARDGVICRQIFDDNIIGIVDNPDLVW